MPAGALALQETCVAPRRAIALGLREMRF